MSYMQCLCIQAPLIQAITMLTSSLLKTANGISLMTEKSH